MLVMKLFGKHYHNLGLKIKRFTLDLDQEPVLALFDEESGEQATSSQFCHFCHEFTCLLKPRLVEICLISSWYLRTESGQNILREFPKCATQVSAETFSWAQAR